MKKVLYLLLLCPLLIVAQENKDYLLSISEITVKQGHNEAFLQGVKSWKECYLENKGEDKWGVWHRLQGEGNVYVLSGRMANWAEFDKDDDAAGKECQAIVLNLIMPHVESFKFSIAQTILDWSSESQMENVGLVWNTFFEIQNSADFKEVVQGIQSALKSSNDDRNGKWFTFMGGDRDDADYFVSTPFSKFADLDKDEDGVWQVYEKVNGKKKADELRAKFRSSVVDVWSYIYTLNKDLSN